MKNQNKKILNVLKDFDKLNYKISNKYGKINALSLSFVEISKLVASSILNQKSLNKNKVELPFCNNEYLKKNIRLKNSNNLSINYIYKFKEEFVSSLKKYSISNFKVHSKIYSEFEKKLNKKNKYIKKTYFKPIYINDYEDQLNDIFSFLEKYKRKQNIQNKFFSENFVDYISKFFTQNKNEINFTDFLLVGSNSNIENRIMSANYILNKKKVISFNHANYSTLVYGEPLQEIGEYSFCNFYIDHGNLRFKKKYFKSNYFHPKILRCNFDEVSIKNDKKQSYILYLPDSFHGNYRHGPWRDMDDKEYFEFQKKIISFNNNIKIKTHPKQIAENISKKINHKNKNIINGHISKFLNSKNIFIIDRLSQIFFTVANSNSKIIFLDLGVRKIKKEILDLLKKRTIYLKTTTKKIKKREFNKLLVKQNKLNKDIIKKCLKNNNNIDHIIKKLF